jgi:hypothetical protein
MYDNNNAPAVGGADIEMMAYRCVNPYEICELLQLFDPSLIAENDIAVVRRGWP